MSYFEDAIKAYLEKRETKYVDVEELGAEGKPLRLYYKPFTMGEMIDLRKKHADISDGEAMIDLIVRKSMDENGQRLLTVEHKMILRLLPPEVVYKIGTPMMLTATVEDAEGN